MYICEYVDGRSYWRTSLAHLDVCLSVIVRQGNSQIWVVVWTLYGEIYIYTISGREDGRNSGSSVPERT